jgi:uncharacterized Zn-finger protein
MDKFHNNYDIPEKKRTIEVNIRNIKCGLDHPVVYYAIGSSDFIHCDYCSIKYVYIEK